jgi:FkbM family methyltransferase
MKVSRLNRRRLIFSRAFSDAIKSDPIVLADVGARGELDEPWLGLCKEAIRVIGFEPDIEECNRLNQLCPANQMYLPVGLWSSEGMMNIHIADAPSCSSVYPPNFELIKKYHERHWKPRVTKKVVWVNCTTLDKALNEKDIECDFLKIDTQGSEFEILQGARASLQNDIFGVLVETWTSEVHRGQRLTGDILTMMSSLGFTLFDINVAAAWQRECVGSPPLLGKSQITGLDLLFFKESSALRSARKRLTKVLKMAAIAEVYGFPDYSVELMSAGAEFNLIGDETLTRFRAMVIQNFRAEKGARHKVKRKLHSLLGIQQIEFPSLHY